MNKDNFRFRDWLLFAAYSIVAVRLSFLMAVGPKSLYPRNIAWLGQDDPATHYLGWLFFRNSECFIVELREQCYKICLNPVGFRRRLELSDDLRSCAYGNYVIFFESTEDQVTIIRILHGARDIPQEFDPS